MMIDRPLRILLVDDDEDDHLMLRDLLSELRGQRFKLTGASTYEDGKNALLQADSKEPFDACFLDFRLDGRTGLDLLKEVTAAGCRTPIILLTGYGEHEVDLEAMRVGAADYLVKDQVTPFLIERSIRYSIHRKRNLESIQGLLDSTFEGIIVHDRDGVILHANRSAADIFGYEAKDMVGTPLSRYCGEDCQSAVLDETPSLAKAPVEGSGIKSDGSRLDLAVVGKPFQYKDQAVRLISIRDITSKKQMEAQILMQDRMASVGLLASSLAHEIGTPLGVIRGRAEYLGIQIKDDPNVKKNVDVILSQIDRVSKLIRSLLTLARGDQAHHAGEISLNEVVSEVIDLMGHELRRHGIEIRNEIPKNVALAVHANAESLHQVLLNLLVNSVHAIGSAVKDGRADGHFIRVSTNDLGPQWSLSVQDTGCGISAANLRNLFKPFFTTKEIGVGTGLGLATSYRIVESWGGSIQVESKEGVGTEFRILLPKKSA